ncbi:hypothetical protein H5410_062503 [Solanum commersonii]|uniref:Uncharacterized protein n=1 Tax=Solanum commersonii TaxID=4109 RepID=A0A9J5WAU9_SOLCO|nr:hypothetical protein H5410_062503 [Solanum commersonii]
MGILSHTLLSWGKRKFYGYIKKKKWKTSTSIYMRNQAAKNKKEDNTFEETFYLLNEKHNQTVEENKIIRVKIIMHYKQIKEEMKYQGKFFKD